MMIISAENEVGSQSGENFKHSRVLAVKFVKVSEKFAFMVMYAAAKRTDVSRNQVLNSTYCRQLLSDV